MDGTLLAPKFALDRQLGASQQKSRAVEWRGKRERERTKKRERKKERKREREGKAIAFRQYDSIRLNETLDRGSSFSKTV